MSLLNIGTTALSASQAMLTVTGHNIANVNTAGYSRQNAEIATAGGQYTGSGFFGRGVDVQSIVRSHTNFLTTQAATTRSLSAADSIRATKLGQLEQVFPVGEAGLGTAANDFFNSFSDLANTPNDLTVRAVVLARADELAARFQTASSRLDDLQQGTNEQLRGAISQINSMATRIAAINQQISNASGTGQTPNDLLDQRDQLINELNQQIQTTTVAADDGTVSVFIAGGQALVVGTAAAPVQVSADPSDPAKSLLSIKQAGQTLTLDPSSLGGGEVSGLLRFKNVDLPEARNQLGRMAMAIGNTVNSQHALGVDLSGNPGAAFFSIPISNGFANANNTGSARIQVALNDVNGTALKPSDYQIDFTSASSGTITRLSDGVVINNFSSLPLATPLDGLNISVASGTANAGDRFLIKPAAAAAQMSLALTSPRQIAATPVSFAFGGQNSGSLAVASLRGPAVGATQAAQTNPFVAAPVTLTFTAAGTFDVVGNGTGNPLSVAYTPGSPISYNGWSLTLNGTPSVGDTITIGPFSGVGKTGPSLLNGTPLNDYYATMLSDIGTSVQTAKASASVSKSIASDAETSRSSVSAVNLDEEAARLIQYQQSYQAAGKLLQISQNVFDTLLQTISR